jgi:hypothetical protein
MPLATHLGTWNIGTVKNTKGSTAGNIANMGITLVAQSFNITTAMNTGDYIPTGVWLPIGSFVTSVIFDLFQEARGSQCPGGNTFPQVAIFGTSFAAIGETSTLIVADGSDWVLNANTRYICPPIYWNNNPFAPYSGINTGNPNVYASPTTDRQLYFIELVDSIAMTGKCTIIYGLRTNIYNAN